MSTETFVLPPRHQVGYLDPSIAGEGQSIIHSDGEQVTWTPPPEKPAIPDWSQVKQLRKYFGRTGVVTWPSWIYHPTEDPRIVKNADEAAALGLCFREATENERSKYGRTAVWDWKDDCLWRPEPYNGTIKFDPKRPDHGKTVVTGKEAPGVSQQTIDAIVATAVASAMKSAPPTHVDPTEWAAFHAFQAWQKSQGGSSREEVSVEEVKAHHTNALAAALDNSDEDDRVLLEAEAALVGVKVDKRWSVDRLRSEVSKKAAA